MEITKSISATRVNSLLATANYVRNETLINGNQAAQLDNLTAAITELTARVNEYAARIADRTANGLNVERLQKWMESAKGKLTAAVDALRVWLVDFKANRPNVKIDIETPATPETETTTNTETAMTTTDTTNNVTTAITNELNARNDKSTWSKAVTAYALELVETLDNWDKQPESVAELREMMLNGASDWNAYSWGGSSLICNGDIAERCCTPSELKRATNKNGLRDMANAREHWLDVQARALYQAANLVCNIANKYFNA